MSMAAVTAATVTTSARHAHAAHATTSLAMHPTPTALGTALAHHGGRVIAQRLVEVPLTGKIQVFGRMGAEGAAGSQQCSKREQKDRGSSEHGHSDRHEPGWFAPRHMKSP